MPNLFLIVIVFIAGLAIEALGTAISVIGVSAMFGGNLIIIAFILAIDIGKIVTISAAYNYWEYMARPLRVIAIIAVAATMTISTWGAAGYFSGEFRKAMIGNQTVQIEIVALESQIAKYESRKKQIDDQIAALPNNYANARVRMMNAFKAEQVDISRRINEIEGKLPALKAEHLSIESKAGPILSISKSLDVPVDWVLNAVIGILILVFNPFAVFLVTLGNFLVKLRTKKKEALQYAQSIVNAPVAVAPAVVRDEPVTDSVQIVAGPVEGIKDEVPVQEEIVTHIPPAPIAEESVTESAIDAPPEPVKPVVESVVLRFEDAVNVGVADSVEIKVKENLQPLRERHVSRVAVLPPFKSLMLDEKLKNIADGTEIDAFTPSASGSVYN